MFYKAIVEILRESPAVFPKCVFELPKPKVENLDHKNERLGM